MNKHQALKAIDEELDNLLKLKKIEEECEEEAFNKYADRILENINISKKNIIKYHKVLVK